MTFIYWTPTQEHFVLVLRLSVLLIAWLKAMRAMGDDIDEDEGDDKELGQWWRN